MSDDVSDIGAFYDANAERERARLEQHQLEYDLTWRYLERYLPAQGAILEVGAATGRYTLELARRGYHVTAVDLSPVEVDVCRQSVVAAGFAQQVQCVVADARDLNGVTRRDYDAVLLMGPLYHLIEASDRQAAIVAAYDRLRPGGIVVSALLSRCAVMSDLIKNNPAWIEDQPHVQSLLTRGYRPDDAPRGGFRGYFAQVAEIAPLHEASGFQTLVLAGVEPVIGADDASYNRLQGVQREQWLDLLEALSTEPSILGASRHLLYVGRKEIDPPTP